MKVGEIPFQIAEDRDSEEQVLFSSKRGVDLYGVLYPAGGEAKGSAVICAPDAEKRTWSQRTLVGFSRRLAAEGYTVLRFDYMGQGESGGEYEQSTLSTRQDDIEAAIEFLLGRTGSARVGLHGLRLGGSLASLVAAKNAFVKYVTLWEPIIDLPGYVYHLLRVNISSQMVMHKAVMKNREKLVEEILAGGRVSINGFYLTKEFFQEATATKLDGPLSAFAGNRFIALLSGTRFPVDGLGGIVRLDFPLIWKEPKVYCAGPRRLIDETLNWIKQNA